jgi:hypothetical protein
MHLHIRVYVRVCVCVCVCVCLCEHACTYICMPGSHVLCTCYSSRLSVFFTYILRVIILNNSSFVEE